jgi:predicted Na+-dependent transporter
VSTLQNLLTFAFVLTSMLSMGLSLTVSQIIQPLRIIRLVSMALAANFVVLPAAAFALSRIIPKEQQ